MEVTFFAICFRKGLPLARLRKVIVETSARALH